MKKIAVILLLAVILVPSAAFAKEKKVRLTQKQQVAVLVEQIRALQERLYVLESLHGISTTTPTTTPKSIKGAEPVKPAPSCWYEVGSKKSGYQLHAHCGG